MACYHGIKMAGVDETRNVPADRELERGIDSSATGRL